MSESSPTDARPPRGVLARISGFFGYLGGIGILVMICHVVLDVVMRYFFNQTAPATLEVSQFWYMPIIVFLGMGVAQRTAQHISAPIIYDRLSPRLQFEFTVIGTALSVALLLGYAWYGLEEALQLMRQGAIGLGSGVPIWQPRFLVPLGATLFAVELIISLAQKGAALRRATRQEQAA